MAKIQTIKNKDNKTIYPQTHTQAVYDANGKKLQEWMNTYVTIANTSVADNTISLKKLKDINNNTIYPRTRTDAVYDTAGSNLDTIHQKFISSASVENTENVGVTCENTTNKVTTITASSTDVQYPSAKAVYDFGMAIKAVSITIEIAKNGLASITSPSLTTIYLVANEASENMDSYDEYLYINNKWERIGTTKIDLSDYATTEYVNNQIGDINSILSTLTVV